MANQKFVDPAAMTVTCPRCGKRPGERCIGGYGIQTTPHAARRRLGAAQAGVIR